MGAWQARNVSLAGQKWEAWQKIMCKTGRTAWLGRKAQYSSLIETAFVNRVISEDIEDIIKAFAGNNSRHNLLY